MKRIGLIGGVGYPTTIEYYARIMKKCQAMHPNLDVPEMVIYSLSHGRFKRCEDTGDLDAYVGYILEGIRAVVAAGADFVALAANSPHRVLDRLRGATSVPIVSALDSAVARAVDLRMKTGLLMGIRFTMQSGFFQERFAKEGIALVTPDPADQEVIQQIIDTELMHSVIAPRSRRRLLDIVARHAVDGVVLGCMRLPLILSDGMDGVRFVDTLDLHTTDIVAHAMPVA